MPNPKVIKIKQPFANETVNLALDTLGLKKQALIFVSSKRSAEKCAEDISLKVQKSSEVLETISESIIKAIAKPTRQCERLSRCLKKGIAFHHSGLTAKQRDIIEDNFKLGNLKIICCTPTLAAGMDLPAFRSIIRDLKRYSSSGWGGMQYIPVLEYLQMAGRAGRPKFDTVGETICIAPTEQEKVTLWEKYINGVPEDIYSKLAVEPVLRTYLLSLIATEFVRSRKDIVNFFSRTFWAHQFRDMPKLESIIDKVLDLLERYEFIITQQKSGNFMSASDIKSDEEQLIRPTLLGLRVAQLYIDPLTAHLLIKRVRRSTDHMISPFGILQMVCNTLEMRPLLRVKTKEFDKFNEQYTLFESEILQKEPSIYEAEYDDFLASVKTAFFMYDWIEEKDEEFLYNEYDIRPGETRVKLDKANWLLYSVEELAKLMSFHDIIKHISKVRFRIRYGVKEELIPLLKLRGIGRIRARKIYNAGVKDIGAVKRINIISLAQLIGKATAISIKKQVGEDVEKVVIPEGKRKGQMSLSKYAK